MIRSSRLPPATGIPNWKSQSAMNLGSFWWSMGGSSAWEYPAHSVTIFVAFASRRPNQIGRRCSTPARPPAARMFLAPAGSPTRATFLTVRHTTQRSDVSSNSCESRSADPSVPAMWPRLIGVGDDAVGRYIYVDIEDVQYRIYYEETGSGIPLLMQHTAGTDGRQWRHILEDRDYQRDFQLIAYDLPYHGKSLPPTSRRWWAEEYRPTRRWYIHAIRAISGALELHRPVFMGCSIGGLLAPALAFECPEGFRSVIGVNGGFTRRQQPYRQRIDTGEMAQGMQANTWFHPRVADGWKGASMMGLMAPDSPLAYQRESAWLYEQGAPPIFHGDALATMYEFDLSEEQAAQIDTSKVDVYLLTGEYDPFAIGGESERLARCIDGATFRLISGARTFCAFRQSAGVQAGARPGVDRDRGKVSVTSARPKGAVIVFRDPDNVHLELFTSPRPSVR